MTPEIHQREMSPELDSVPPQPREISTTGQQPRIGAMRQYSLPGQRIGVRLPWRDVLGVLCRALTG